MSGLLRAIVTITPAALLALSAVHAQDPRLAAQPAPLSGFARGAGFNSPDPCQSAPRAGTLDAHERIALLCPDSLELAAVHDLTDLLSSRVPGLMVQETGGVTGSGARIRLRGPGSIVLDNEPVFILDGVRIFAEPADATVLQPLPSRVDDIHVSDIAAIEVLHGPATAAMYGTGSAAGVIRITTKRGAAGTPRWGAFAEAGPALEVTRYPANYSQSGTRTSDGAPVGQCGLYERALGTCVPDATPLASFSPLEEVSPFQHGLRQRYGAYVGGTSGMLRFHAGAGRMNEEGVVAANDLSRTNFRLNVGVTPIRDLTVSFTSAYLVGEAGYPAGPNVIENPLYRGLVGFSFDDPVNRGYLFPAESLDFRTWHQDVRRLDAGASAQWAPLSWLAVSAAFGIDRTDVEDLERTPFASSPEGEFRRTESIEVKGQTAALGATALWSPGHGLRATSSLGLERHETWFDQETYGNSGAGVFRLTLRSDREVLGIFVRQHLAWGERLAVHAALRRDEFRSGTGSRPEPLSGSAGLSWLARRKPEDAHGFLGAVRLHLAYGRVDTPPGPFDLPLLGPLLPPPRYQDPDPPGPPELERTAELEAGVASSLLHDRLQFSFTGYRKVTTNGLIFLNSYGSGQSRVTNDGRFRNTGIETTLGGTMIDARAAKLAAELGISRNINKASALQGGPVFGGSVYQQHREGYTLGGYWERPLLGYDDLNGDGIISPLNCVTTDTGVGGPECEIELGTSRYLGSPIPRTEVFFAPKLTLLGRIDISALVDYRGGFKQFNATEWRRCQYDRCRAVSDPTAPLAEQAKAVAAAMGTRGGYVEDADFVKLRELAVSIAAPRSWTSAIGGGSAKLTLAGRNLATWTDYTGLDPEVNTAGPRGFGQEETFGLPPVRYYTARLSVGW